MARGALPAGFKEFSIQDATVVCASHTAFAVREAMRGGTMYDFAARQPGARALAGRGTAYAVQLPGEVEQVVVRHNRHGGLFAPLTGDLFRAPSRAPYELSISHALQERGVPTPTMLGYAVYPAALGLRRADVWTREIPNSSDLSAALLSHDASVRADALSAAAQLVAVLSHAHGWHQDLNIKNVLLQRVESGSLTAFALDVDRVVLDAPVSALDLNLKRFRRSALKWRDRYGARVTDAELDAFERAASATPVR